MTQDSSKLETEILESIRSILAEYSVGLRQHGFLSERLSLSRSGSDKTSYQSEVEITFWENENFLDIIEFFIYQDGKPVTTAQEIGPWFREQLREMIFTQQRKRGEKK